jgi:hypothetical protein
MPFFPSETADRPERETPDRGAIAPTRLTPNNRFLDGPAQQVKTA